MPLQGLGVGEGAAHQAILHTAPRDNVGLCLTHFLMPTSPSQQKAEQRSLGLVAGPWLRPPPFPPVSVGVLLSPRLGVGGGLITLEGEAQWLERNGGESDLVLLPRGPEDTRGWGLRPWWGANRCRCPLPCFCKVPVSLCRAPPAGRPALVFPARAPAKK